MRRPTIRWRLTLWHGAVLSAILIAFSTGVYGLMRHYLISLTDDALAEEISELRGDVARCPNEAAIAEEFAARYFSHQGYECQVSTAQDEVLFQSEGLAGHALSQAGSMPLSDRTSYRSLWLGPLGHVRTAGLVVAGPAGSLAVQATVSLVNVDHALRKLLMVFLTIGPLAVAGALVGGYVLARQALAPVDRMAATAAEITATRLDRRVDAPNDQDELGRLARTFNDMIARLQRSFEEVKRFTADAAHELRTPLAMIQSEAEVALRSPRDPERDAQVLEDILEEVERLGRLVTQLLFLCREDTGLATGQRKPVRLDEVIRDVADHMQVVAREKGIELEVRLEEPCRVLGDEDRLRQVFFNLIDNALKYTTAGGKITVQGEAPDGQVRVTVADTGIGIPSEHLPRVFDRFFRVDPSRSPEMGGTGLGLAICRSIVEAHGGRVELDSAVGRGTRVSLLLTTRARNGAGST